jgi:hypothetical protein
LWKHLDANLPIIFKKFQEEINCQVKENFETQLAQKRANIFSSSMFEFFASKDPFKKDDVEEKMFMENLALLIVKNHLLLQFIERVWLKHSMLQLSP